MQGGPVRPLGPVGPPGGALIGPDAIARWILEERQWLGKNMMGLRKGEREVGVDAWM